MVKIGWYMGYMLLWITFEAISASAKHYTVHKHGRQKSKLDKLSCKIIWGFSRLSLSNKLRVISSLGVLTVRIGGAKLDKNNGGC